MKKNRFSFVWQISNRKVAIFNQIFSDIFPNQKLQTIKASLWLLKHLKDDDN